MYFPSDLKREKPMKITVYRHKGVLKYRIPYVDKSFNFLEFDFALTMLTPSRFADKFGDDMPEIVVDCELDEDEAEMIENARKTLRVFYKV